MSTESADGVGSILFEALIVPHRSLSRRGVCRLALVIAALGSLIGLRFWFLGAWPVIAFSGTEIGILVVLLALNVRRARNTERVLLSRSILRVERTAPSGRLQIAELPVPWLNVILEEQAGVTPRLLLTTRGASHEIGTSLGEAEKRSLADAVRAALHDVRNPVFDNPQLRS